MDYLREFLYDTVNRKVIMQFLDTSVCQAKYAASFCNEFRDDIEGDLDRFFDTAFKVTLNKDFVCHYVFPVCEKPVYKTTNIQDYRTRVLSDKPVEIQGDDYINKVYQSIRE